MSNTFYSLQDVAKLGQRETMCSVLGPLTVKRDDGVLIGEQDMSRSSSLGRGGGRSTGKALRTAHLVIYGMLKPKKT